MFSTDGSVISTLFEVGGKEDPGDNQRDMSSSQAALNGRHMVPEPEYTREVCDETQWVQRRSVVVGPRRLMALCSGLGSEGFDSTSR
jgi:hypothetical protein